MFQITPVELHEGWIVGEERTITTVSGDYDWSGASEPRVMVIDNDGRFSIAGSTYTVTGSPGAWTVSLTIQDWSDIAVITSGDDKNLTVVSTPLEADITGDLEARTPFTVERADGSSITLVADATKTDGSTNYAFSRWVLETDPGLVAGYKLDEPEGPIDTVLDDPFLRTSDSSGHNRDGIIRGASWVYDVGARRWALHFDGIDDEANVGNSAALNVTGAFSVALWMKPDQTGTGLAGVAGKDTERFAVAYLGSASKVIWYVGGTGVSGNVTKGQWNHVVATFDGTTMKLYVNSGIPGNIATSFTSIDTGGDVDLGFIETLSHFKGSLADVKFYDRPLSASDVSTQYAAGVTGWKDRNGQVVGEQTVVVNLDEHTTAIAEYKVSVPLPGDYNLSDTVDAADYVVWRNTLGNVVAPFSGADGSGNGIIDQADYGVWRANFGKVMASGTGSIATATTAIDEPIISVPEYRDESLALMVPTLSQTATDNVTQSSPIAATIQMTVTQSAKHDQADLMPQSASVPPASAFSMTRAVQRRLLPIGVVDHIVESRTTGLLAVRQKWLSLAASRDNGLVAWLASRSTGPRHEVADIDWKGSLGNFDQHDCSDQLDDATDLAFASLWA